MIHIVADPKYNIAWGMDASDLDAVIETARNMTEETGIQVDVCNVLKFLEVGYHVKLSCDEKLAPAVRALGPYAPEFSIDEEGRIERRRPGRKI